jgi:sRNA-binding protein
MPTLTAPIAARAAAQQRGLVLAPEPKPRDPEREERRTRQQAARARLWSVLSTTFPEIFKLPPVPLAIGIHKQILEVAGDDIDPGDLGAFLRYWVRRWSYLHAIWRGEKRRNIDGSVAGVPTVDQRNAAGYWMWGARHRPIPESTGDLAITAESVLPAAAVAGAASPEPPAAPAASPLASMAASAGRA